MSDLDTLRADPRVVVVRDVLRFSDCDMLGHVNNVVYATLCESGRVAYLRERLGAVEAAGGVVVIAKLAISFEAELHYPGEVETATWLARLGRTSFTVAQEIFSGGRRVASAEGVCVVIDAATRRPMPIEGDLRVGVEGLARTG